MNRLGNLDLVGWLCPQWLDVSFRENFASFPRGWEAKSTIPYRWRRRLASACAEDPGIASWGDRWRMTMMIVSISVCSGHIQLSTTTVYLEGSRFDIWPFLIWREPVVAAPVHGRLWRKLIAQLAEVRQIWFVNLRRNIVHEASCWRDARMRPNIVWSIYIYSRAMGKVRLRHSCMKRLWCLYRGWNRSIGVWRNVSWTEEFLEKWTSVSRQLFTSLIYKGTIELISASYHLRGVVAELWYRSSSSCKLSIVNFRFWMLKQL